jgi:ribosome-associated translation inhibitor RaiA
MVMQLEVRCRGMESSELLLGHIERRTRFQLGRFAHEISRVGVHLDDVNGPRGGVDTRCLVTVHGPWLGQLTLDELGVDAYRATSRALKRIARVVARSLARRQSARGRRLSLVMA